MRGRRVAILGLAALVAGGAATARGHPGRAAAGPPTLLFASDRAHDYLPEVYSVSLGGGSPVDVSRDPLHSDELLGVDAAGDAILLSDRSGRPVLLSDTGGRLHAFGSLPAGASNVYAAWAAGSTVTVEVSLEQGPFSALEVLDRSGRHVAELRGARSVGRGSSPLSADGRRIAYAPARAEASPRVLVASATGRRLWSLPGSLALWAAAAPLVAISTQPSRPGGPSSGVLADEAGHVLQRFQGTALAIAPDGGALLVTRGRQGVELVSRSGRVHEAPSGQVVRAAFSPDGRYLLLDSDPGSGMILATATGRLVGRRDNLVDWLPRSRGLLAEDRTARGRAILVLVTLQGRVQRRIALAGDEEDVHRMMLTAGGRRLVYGVEALHVHRLYERTANGQLRALTSGLVEHLAPSVSPDGQRVADVEFSEPCGICFPRVIDTFPLDGSAPAHALPVQTQNDEHPSWSPDGASIAFAVALSDDRLDAGITIERVDGKTHSQPAGAADGSDPAWSPDGASIAFVGPNGLELVSASDGRVRPLVPPSAATGDSSFRSPAWSPDGSRIAFADLDGIELVAADGSGLQRILEAQHVHSLAWSPDGASIAFSACQAGCGTDDVWTVRPDGNGLTRVTSDVADDTTPAWLPASP